VTTRIRPIQKEDLARVLIWRNHPDVRRYMYTQQEIAWEAHVAWFEKICGDKNRHVMIFERDSVSSGLVSINIVSLLGGRADWGFYLSPECPKGSGALLGDQACRFSFEELFLHKLCGEVLSYNYRSARFHERLGFRQEAILRDHHYDGERYHDVLGFGLLSNEWKKDRSEKL